MHLDQLAVQLLLCCGECEYLTSRYPVAMVAYTGVRCKVSHGESQVDPTQVDKWALHTVKDGAIASAEAWFAASLATAQPGITAYVLCPGKQAQASVEKLRAMLLAGGCMCSLEEPELFTYIGCVSESCINLHYSDYSRTAVETQTCRQCYLQ